MWAVANGNVLEIDMESFQSYVPSVRLMTYCKMNALRSNHLMSEREIGKRIDTLQWGTKVSLSRFDGYKAGNRPLSLPQPTPHFSSNPESEWLTSLTPVATESLLLLMKTPRSASTPPTLSCRMSLSMHPASLYGRFLIANRRNTHVSLVVESNLRWWWHIPTRCRMVSLQRGG